MDKKGLLQQFKEGVKNCRKCGLCKTRGKVVFGEGDPESDILFIGEAPGYYEDRSGSPFVGRSGGLLNKFIEMSGAYRSDVYIANVVKCRPTIEDKNRKPSEEEIKTCLPYLERQIEIINPKAMVMLGGVAFNTLIDPNTSISEVRGRWIEHGERLIIPTFHPAFLLRNPEHQSEGLECIRKVIRKFL